LVFFHLDFRGEPGKPDGAFLRNADGGRKLANSKRISSSETSKPSPIFRGREKCVIDEELSS
jgi:hypothetical protein